jgi:hypothetical protein
MVYFSYLKNPFLLFEERRNVMETFVVPLQLGLVYGLVLSGLMSSTFVTMAYINAEMWLPDYPPDIQQRFGPMSERAKRQRKLASLPVGLFLIGTILLLLVHLANVLDRSLSFGAVFLSTATMLLLFNVVDLLVVDWLIGIRICPRFIILPGTEGAAGYHDYAFHFRAFLKGTVGCVIASLLIAGSSRTVTILFQ